MDELMPNAVKPPSPKLPLAAAPHTYADNCRKTKSKEEVRYTSLYQLNYPTKTETCQAVGQGIQKYSP